MTNEDMIQALAEVTERAKTNTHRIDELALGLTALNKMATALESKPMRRIGAVLGYILTALCTAVAGALVGYYF